MSIPIIVTPKYETKIPSGEMVKFRPFLVKEEKVMLMMKESDSSKDIIRCIETVVQSCIEDETKVEELSYFDLEHLFIHMRSRSVGESIDINYTCDKCNKAFPLEVSIENLSLNKEYPEDVVVMLQENVGVEVQPLNSRSIEKYSGEETDILELSENVIKTVFNDQNVYHFKDFTKKERSDFIESLSLKQIQKIVEKMEEFPRCVIKQKCECKHCGEELDIEVEGLQNFFT
tara:strand:+ start:1653 stop:2345 length:693 start_codon:yes stop_codon:yes gene_type:complete